MSSFNTISAEKLARLIGVPRGPALIDVRAKEDFAADPRFIPGAIRRPHGTVSSWAPEFAGRSAIVICEKGQKLSEGVAAWLRQAGRIVGRSSCRRPLRLGGSGTAARARRQTAPARSAGANRLGDALTTENRSHRLSMAHPSLCRSRSRVPVRFARGSAVGGRALQWRSLRYRRGLLEPPWRTLHVRHDAGRTGTSNANRSRSLRRS